MHVNFLSQQGKLYAKIIGELDHHYATEIKDQLDNKIISEGINTLVFDFSGFLHEFRTGPFPVEPGSLEHQ